MPCAIFIYSLTAKVRAICVRSLHFGHAARKTPAKISEGDAAAHHSHSQKPSSATLRLPAAELRLTRAKLPPKFPKAMPPRSAA